MHCFLLILKGQFKEIIENPVLLLIRNCVKQSSWEEMYMFSIKLEIKKSAGHKTNNGFYSLYQF